MVQVHFNLNECSLLLLIFLFHLLGNQLLLILWITLHKKSFLIYLYLFFQKLFVALLFLPLLINLPKLARLLALISKMQQNFYKYFPISTYYELMAIIHWIYSITIHFSVIHLHKAFHLASV